MDQSNNVPTRLPGPELQIAPCSGTSIFLTATLAIAGMGLPVGQAEARTTAERIETIHEAVKSGVLELQSMPDSGENTLQGRVMQYRDIASPRPPDDGGKKGK